MFTTPQVNASDAFPYIWIELPITLTFESDWELAKGTFREIAHRHGKHTSELRHALHSRYAVDDLDGEPIVYTSVADSGVTLTIRVLCDVRGARATEQRLWEDVLRAVAGWENVDFAYPTTRFYDNRREGKTGRPGPAPPAGAGNGTAGPAAEG